MNQKTNCPHCRNLFEVPGESFDTIVSCPTCNGKFNPMKEYVKASWELTKTPEFRASFKAHMAEANKNITHADFVAGVQNRTIGLKVPFGEPSQLLRGGRKTVFDILVLLYAVAPFVLVPLWAYHEHNWWLLIGILISRLSTRAAPWFLPGYEGVSTWSGKRDSAEGLLLLLCIVLWFTQGIHSYLTFFSLCALWGFMLFHRAEKVQNRYAIRSLIESPELFYEAVAQSKIMIVRHDAQAV